VGPLVTTAVAAAGSGQSPADRTLTLVWIDSREAFIVHWAHDAGRTEHLLSDVPIHHRSTGHVRHDPRIRSGGGGPPQTAGEPRRLEHIERYLDEVMVRMPDADDLLIVGPGTIREHLAARIRRVDERHRRGLSVSTQAAAPMTPRQLIAHARRAIGGEPPRRRPQAVQEKTGFGTS